VRAALCCAAIYMGLSKAGRRPGMGAGVGVGVGVRKPAQPSRDEGRASLVSVQYLDLDPDG
jgi:hypothetical protein